MNHLLKDDELAAKFQEAIGDLVARAPDWSRQPAKYWHAVSQVGNLSQEIARRLRRKPGDPVPR